MSTGNEAWVLMALQRPALFHGGESTRPTWQRDYRCGGWLSGLKRGANTEVIDYGSFERRAIPVCQVSLKIQLRSGYDLRTKSANYELWLRFSRGKGERVLVITHQLMRAFRRALAEGHPPDHWRIFTCEDGPQIPPRVLGTFVRTGAGRVLFFPAVGTRITKGIRQASVFEGHLLDHLTFEPKGRTAHSSHLPVTEATRSRKTRGEGFSFSMGMPRDLMYLFSILTPDLEAYPRLPAQVRAEFSSGKPSIREIGAQLASNLRVAALPAPDASAEHSSLQIDIWVGRGQAWDVKQLEPIPYASNPQFVADAPTEQYSLVAHAMQVSLGEDHGLVVMMWRPRGRINRPMLMRAKLATW